MAEKGLEVAAPEQCNTCARRVNFGGRLHGRVKWFDLGKGYGFITPHAPGDDVYVHFSAIQGRGYRTLREGQTVEFEVGKGDEGFREAQNVQIVL